MKTRMEAGAISPKAWVATLAAVVGYLVTQELVDFPAWGDLVLMTVLVALGAYAAPPGPTVTEGR